MTIVVDASAIVAIFMDEPEAGVFNAIIADADVVLMSPVNYWEVTTTVRARGGEPAVRSVERLMSSMELVVEPVSVAQTRQAVLAASRYGKGHPARLNMGDCFAYALAKTTGAALLYKGADFPQTDIPSAL